MPAIYLILDNIRSLYNVGSMFRTADAFGVSKIYLCGHTGYPAQSERAAREIAKTALGADKTIPWEHIPQTWRLVEKLKKEGVQILALENTVPKTEPLQGFTPQFPCALIVGNEVKGIAGNILRRADAVLEIPMHGKKESLNVSVACGIALWHLTK